MRNVGCNMHFTLHEQKNSTCRGAVSCVCVHLPAIGVYAVWLDALLPLQLPCKTEISTVHPLQHIFICVCVGVCVGTRALFLTLNVYLLHLIDFCDGLPKLFCKFPELFSAWGAEAHQLLFL